jgi:hypothetical protein
MNMEKIWMVHPDGRRKPVTTIEVMMFLKAEGWQVEGEEPEPEIEGERRRRGRPAKVEE